MSGYAFSLIFLGILPPFLLFLTVRAERKGDIAHPLTVMAWTVVVAYSLKSIYLAYAVDAGVPFRTKAQSGEILYIGQFVVLAAAAAMSLGYLVMPKKGFRGRQKTRPRNPTFWRVVYWLVFVACLAALAKLFVMKGLHIQLMTLQFTAAKYYIDEASGVQSSLGFLLMAADVIIVYFLYYLALGGKFFRINPYTLAIVFVGLTYFLSSQRTGVLNILICILIMSRKNLFAIQSRSAIKRVLMLAAVIPVLSVASNIREQRREVSASELSIAAGLESTANHVFEGFYALDPIKITMIVQSAEEHLMGQSFVMFVIAPIPRIIWPDKPLVRLGPYVAQALLDFNNNSGAPPSAVGELYINFGVAGVIGGMFLMGMGLKLVRQTYSLASDEVFARVRYTLAMMVCIDFMIADFSYAVLFIFKYGFAVLICEKYWNTRGQVSALSNWKFSPPSATDASSRPAPDGALGLSRSTT